MESTLKMEHTFFSSFLFSFWISLNAIAETTTRNGENTCHLLLPEPCSYCSLLTIPISSGPTKKKRKNNVCWCVCVCVLKDFCSYITCNGEGVFVSAAVVVVSLNIFWFGCTYIHDMRLNGHRKLRFNANERSSFLYKGIECFAHRTHTHTTMIIT